MLSFASCVVFTQCSANKSKTERKTCVALFKFLMKAHGIKTYLADGGTRTLSDEMWIYSVFL